MLVVMQEPYGHVTIFMKNGTMQAGSGFYLGVAKATKELHVKGMAPSHRWRLARIIGDFSNDEGKKDATEKAEKDTKGLGVKAPKDKALEDVVLEDATSEGVTPKDKAPVDSALKVTVLRDVGIAHPSGRSDAVAASAFAMSPPGHGLNKKGKLRKDVA
jgi:hypothetical protein